MILGHKTSEEIKNEELIRKYRKEYKRDQRRIFWRKIFRIKNDV